MLYLHVGLLFQSPKNKLPLRYCHWLRPLIIGLALGIYDFSSYCVPSSHLIKQH